MKKNKAIAVLGGMGPEASVYMYKLLIELSIKYFGAINNDDFPEVILSSIPVPDFISNDKDKEKALFMLQERVVQLNKLDISCLSIACNTAHVLLEDLQKVSRVKFISMIDEVVEKVSRDKKKTVGILGTPSTLHSNIYQYRLEKYRIRSIIPEIEDLPIIEAVIRNVIKGKLKKRDQQILVKISNYLKKRGAEGIILGCTELPLIFPFEYSLPVYNSVEILAKALLRKYYGNKLNSRSNREENA